MTLSWLPVSVKDAEQTGASSSQNPVSSASSVFSGALVLGTLPASEGDALFDAAQSFVDSHRTQIIDRALDRDPPNVRRVGVEERKT